MSVLFFAGNGEANPWKLWQIPGCYISEWVTGKNLTDLCKSITILNSNERL